MGARLEAAEVKATNWPFELWWVDCWLHHPALPTDPRHERGRIGLSIRRKICVPLLRNGRQVGGSRVSHELAV
jgi:hypothetical protein